MSDEKEVCASAQRLKQENPRNFPQATLANAETKLKTPLANESGDRCTERGLRNSRNNNESRTKSKLARSTVAWSGVES